ncbi:ankyrin repeat domain-containing protein 27-like [Symsagittifera roscoffensis]|uniref:ankyrin repeat domain-containing protein 27-like n=1 Tax=Symsagittifera roscoffensis TaxID=84072 RepID=UPI00307C17E9
MTASTSDAQTPQPSASTSGVQQQSIRNPFIPSDRLFLDFCGTGESADICSPLLAQLTIKEMPSCVFPSSPCADIPEFGSYPQHQAQIGMDYQNNHGKQAKKKFRVGRLEGLKAAHIWCQDYKGRLLRKAVQNEDIAGIQDLINEGVHVDNCDEKQRTALHLACVKGNNTIVSFLLSHGANPNCKDVNLNTPLMLACLSRNIPTITLLLKKGANPNLCDSKGNNALNIAQNRLTHLQQCQVACEYLRDELMHIITMIREFIHRSEQIQNSSNSQVSRVHDLSAAPSRGNNEPRSTNSSSLEELHIETLISKLSFSSDSKSSDESQNITRQVADEFQELLVKFSSHVKVS